MADSETPKDPAVERELERQLKYLEFGTTEITPREEFIAMLRNSLQNNKPLRVKCGIDPTSPDVHLGHLVPYRKMRQFQDLGHVGVVIIGDYTASIGDPSGKNESRPALEQKVIWQNAERYMDQVSTVVDRDRLEIFHQSEWFKEITLREVLEWAAQTTVAKLLSHETFHERLERGFSLALHELFYPVLQGIDSVKVDADVELGGSDQKFNVLMGRDYQRNAGQRAQVGMFLPIITGTCGTQKMSKSLNNYIGIEDAPFDKFGKVMSIPDAIMLEWYQYLAGLSEEEFKSVKGGIETGSLHPNNAKKDLAQKIVSFFHGDEVGVQMRREFEDVFKKKQLPDDIPSYEFPRDESLVAILAESGTVKSRKEARRLIEQKAVGLYEGEKIQDKDFCVSEQMSGQVLKIGKRKFLKLI